jgi:hypothetical protein
VWYDLVLKSSVGALKLNSERDIDNENISILSSHLELPDGSSKIEPVHR